MASNNGTASLSGLPPELLLDIVDHITSGTVFNEELQVQGSIVDMHALAATCRSFRKFLWRVVQKRTATLDGLPTPLLNLVLNNLYQITMKHLRDTQATPHTPLPEADIIKTFARLSQTCRRLHSVCSPQIASQFEFILDGHGRRSTMACRRYRLFRGEGLVVPQIVEFRTIQAFLTNRNTPPIIPNQHQRSRVQSALKSALEFDDGTPGHGARRAAALTCERHFGLDPVSVEAQRALERSIMSAHQPRSVEVPVVRSTVQQHSTPHLNTPFAIPYGLLHGMRMRQRRLQYAEPPQHYAHPQQLEQQTIQQRHALRGDPNREYFHLRHPLRQHPTPHSSLRATASELFAPQPRSSRRRIPPPPTPPSRLPPEQPQRAPSRIRLPRRIRKNLKGTLKNTMNYCVHVCRKFAHCGID